MTVLDRSPINMNFLQADGFQVVIRRLPHVTFFTQEIKIPGFTLTPTQQPTPYISIPQTGDHIEFEPLSITFKIDEDLKNFMEIYNWIVGIGYPDDTSQYKALADKGIMSGEGIVSDISIMITTNIKNYNVEFMFRDCFPISLGGFELSTTNPDVTHLSTTATFKYTKYDIIIIPK